MVSSHQGNLAEIAAGEAALEYGTSDTVRDMGATLIEDHQALDEDLTAAAADFGVELPGEPTAEQQATLEDVLSHQGESFDTAWIASQIEAHQMSLAATETQIASGSEPAAIELAEAAAPVIQGHLDHLMELSSGTPDQVPSGLAAAGPPMLLGVSMITLGLFAGAGSLMFFIRRRRHEA
ncbi:putative membrane protein [Nesterenkonia sandarakina]|uniref:Putative membrane protein n=2 Tax=Nesterenkonia sandarakina TaxID=272918 RepID=A0A7Z0E611_9MICC|nr:putative membrane protein [Nesterenkonia sandarakina]